MNKFRNVPAIITLLAGFITSVIMIKYRYTLVNFMWILICVMLAFYICGMLIRFALNKVAEKKENKQKASDEEKEDVSNMEESAQNNCSIWADFVLLSEYILLIGGTDHG